MDVPILCWVLAAALAVPVLLAGLLAVVFHRSIVGMTSDEIRMDPLDEEQLTAISEEIAPIDEWTAAHGLEWVGIFRVAMPNNLPVTMTIWTGPGEGVHLSHVKIATGWVTDIVTGFARDRSLTTSSLASGTLLPHMPEDPVQLYPDLPLDQLWSRHEEGSRYLRGRGWRPFDDPRPIEEIVLAQARKRAQFVRSHTAWPLRMVWWFLMRKRRGRIPLTEQHLADFGHLV